MQATATKALGRESNSVELLESKISNRERELNLPLVRIDLEGTGEGTPIEFDEVSPEVTKEESKALKSSYKEALRASVESSEVDFIAEVPKYQIRE